MRMTVYLSKKPAIIQWIAATYKDVGDAVRRMSAGEAGLAVMSRAFFEVVHDARETLQNSNRSLTHEPIVAE